jgi:nucleotide-binding universal stress UspA family protein
MTHPVLLAYDGSSDSKHAISAAAKLLSCRAAVVVHVCAVPIPPVAAATGAAVALAVDPELTAELEERARKQATRVVGEGVELARAAGFAAEPELVAGDGVHGVWNAIVAVAERRDASVIVIGHRHLSWIGEKLVGSVDRAVVKHSGRPVLVLPVENE